MLMSRRQVTVELDEFGYAELEAVARRQGVTIEDLIAHAAMYYLAQADNGSMAVRVPVDGDRRPAREPS